MVGQREERSPFSTILGSLECEDTYAHLFCTAPGHTQRGDFTSTDLEDTLKPNMTSAYKMQP